MFNRSTYGVFRRLATCLICVATVLLFSAVASAAITSSGDVKPPFALVDTPGDTKNFTMPVNPSSTMGGVYVGDLAAGQLDIDNGWTLNSTFGVVANSQAGIGASELLITEDSIWNVRIDPTNPVFVPPDFEIGRAGTGIANVNLDSTLSVEWQTRLGSLAGANGQLNLSNSTLSTGSLVVGSAGSGTLTSGLSNISAGFIVVGEGATGSGQMTLSGDSVSSAGGVTVGGSGSGILNAFDTTINSQFFDLGRDFAVPDGLSPSATSIGTATLSGPQSLWQNESGTIIALNSRGSLTIEDSATLTTGYLEVSRFGNDGNLSVDNATLTMAMNPNFLSTPALILGTESGSVGHATFSGPDTTVTVANGGFLEIARNSDESSLNVSAGADVSTHDTLIATGVGSIGVLNLGGAGTSWTGSGFFDVGRFGQATFNVFDGANVSTHSGRIAVAATSTTSSANISGVGSRWTTADFVTIGEAGTGALVVSDGAAVDVGYFLSLGNSAGGTGRLEVAGSATDPESPGTLIPSTVTSAYQIAVGHLGEGFAVVHEGARLVSSKADSPTASSGIIGHFSDTEGRVEIRGDGSLWMGDGTVNIGFRGTGTLEIQQGGRVESVDGVMARLPGSSGTVALTGEGSAWLVQDSLYVGGRAASLAPGDEGSAGPGGAATLTVSAGAYVAVGNSIELFDQGTINVAAGGSIIVGQGDPGAAAPSTLHVYAGGSLLGSSNIQGDVINQGLIAPGNSPGTLTISGNYTQSSGAALMIEIAGTTPGEQYDVLNVIGNASISSDTALNVSLVGGFVPSAGDSFEILAVGGHLSGAFTTVALPSLAAELMWNTSQLYSAGTLSVTAAGLSGDYNADGIVNAADYTVWRDNLGTANLLPNDATPGTVTAADYEVWRAHFGEVPGTGSGVKANIVPEPGIWMLLMSAAAGRCRRRQSVALRLSKPVSA
jgi:T5SS/PEP-CTERM-associated repeat protein